MKPRSEWKQPKRSPLPPRRTYLQHGTTPIARGGPIRPRRKRSAAELRAKHEREFGPEDRAAFVQSLPCLVCGYTPAVNAHVGNKGAGTGRKADYDQVVPLCHHHHEESHDGQRTFEIRYGLDLAEECRVVQRAWLAYQAVVVQPAIAGSPHG